MRRVLVSLVSLLACAGCGLGLTDERSGGADNLPTAAAGPYDRVPFDFDTPISEPFVLDERTASLTDPTALAGGAGFRLWFGYRRVDAAPDSGDIWYAELPGVHDLPTVGPQPALVADATWEAGRVARPSVVDLGGDQLALFYEGGPPDAPAIGRADSADGGATWQKHPGNPVLTDAANPGVVHVDQDDSWLVLFEQVNDPGIFLADSTDGVAWQRVAAPVLVARTGNALAFDRAQVADPAPVVRESAAGRVVYGAFFAGANRADDNRKVQIGYSGSFDGLSWERFLGDEPVLIENEAPTGSPTVVIEATSGTMFFHEVSVGRGKIAAAVHP